jgi:SAM-dependent methyltransferase
MKPFWQHIDALDTIQIVLVVIIAALVANYLYVRWRLRVNRESDLDGLEGFANPEGPDGDIVILGNDHLYDEFYAKVYDKVVNSGPRQDAEVNFTLSWARTYRPENEMMQVLDVGCGTGGALEIFRKAGVSKAVGLDASEAMIAAARKAYPKGDYRVGEAENIGGFAAGEFNLATLFYFTTYYLRDRTAAFKNLFNWLQPGGCAVLHLVNREKFDPILDSASPFIAFSVQKYSKERVTHSKVTFDKFDYTADFQLEGAHAEFREEFQFKDGKVRKQTHKLNMPTMDAIVAEMESCGFTYKQFIDMTTIGYEYQYLFCFVR